MFDARETLFNLSAIGITLLACLMIIQPALAEEAVVVDPGSEVQQLNDEVMKLKRELLILEEDLLYPASSRVAVYLGMETGELFDLDAVTLELNGKRVAHHLYTPRERAALHQGGVQSLFVGHARQGENRLTAFFRGAGPHNRAHKRATSVTFEHNYEPVYVELIIRDDAKTMQPMFDAEVH